MAVTRIKNNQITDATITAAKIASQTLVGSLFATDLTLNSNLSVIGNLTVTGISSNINAINTFISDPFVIFNNGYTGSLTNYTIGILVNRNLSSLSNYGAVNTAWVWNEADSAFTGIATTDTGTGIVSLNNSGYANIKIGNLNAVSSVTASSVTATTLTFNNASATTLVATNFSSGNAVISGGYISALSNATIITGNVQSWYATTLNSTNGNISTLTATTFNVGTTTTATLNATTGNITALAAGTTTTATLNATTGNITALAAGTTTTATLNATTGNITALAAGTTTTATLNATTGNITNVTATTLVATNFSSGNAVVTGGSIDNSPIGASTPSTGGFTTATVITVNASTVNAGTTTTATLNATTGNITTLGTGTTTSATLNVTTANLTNARSSTLVATNFSSGNAVVTGGSIDNSPIGASTPNTGIFTTATATTVNASTVNAGTTTSATLNATSGNITALGVGTTTSATLNVTAGNITTLVATNFSSGNAVVTGGYADNFPIGANTRSSGAFTALAADSAVTFTNSTQSDNSSTGALIVTGGVGIGANLNVGNNVTILGNLTVLGNTTTFNTESLTVEDLNITVAANATVGSEANGAGLTVAGANATLTYLNADDSWNLNKKLNATTIGAAVVNITTANIGTVTSTNGLASTLVATNFSSGNAVVTGGSIDNAPIGASTPSTGVFTTATATTLTATTINASTATSATLNATTGNITTLGTGTTTTATLNATTGNIVDAKSTTLVAINFSSGNAVVTGGSIDNSPIGASTPSTGGFTTATATTLTATTINAGTTTSATLNATTGNITSLDASTATSATLNATTGNITNARSTTLVATNFSSGNAVVTGGSIDGTIIGDSSPAAATFVKVTANGNLVAASGVNASSFTTGAIVVPNGGGVGVTGDVYVQGQSTFLGNINAVNIQLSGNINVPVGGTFSNTGTFYGNAAGIGALYAGTPVYTALPTTVVQMTGNVNTYAQVNFQNYSNGSSSTTDFILTADDGTDGSYYGDFGLLGSAYDGSVLRSFSNGLGTVGFPNDTYLYAHGDHATPGIGGNLILGSAVPGTVIRVFAGGMNIADVVTTTTSSGFQVNASTVSTGPTTGALQVTGGTGITGNLNVGSAAAFNVNKTANYDFVVKGVSDNTLLWARPSSTYDQLVIGNSATTGTLVTGAKLIINTTDSILIPAGTTAQRPGSIGGTDTAGMVRFNTSNAQLEFYDGIVWQNTGTDFTVIASELFDGDDTTVTFTLGAAATTQSVIVSLNGVLQIPAIAYSVSGTTLTFTSAPATGDKIEVRRLATTATVSTFESGNGYVSVVTNNSFANINAGENSSTTRMSFNTTGNVSVTANIAPSSNVAYDIGSPTIWWKNIFASKITTGGADIAENYLADAVYSSGTVIEFGGEAEVTVSMTEGSTRVAGVITSDPGHVMNGGLKGSSVASVALVGRVPVNVIGPVYKGDMLISAGYGYARACAAPVIGSVIGKAVANFEGEKGSVEVVVGRL